MQRRYDRPSHRSLLRIVPAIAVVVTAHCLDLGEDSMLRAQEAVANLRRPSVVLLDLDFSPDGQWFATVGDSIRMFHTRTGHQWKQIRTPGLTRRLKFSPVEERVFVTATADGLVQLYRVGREEPLQSLDLHQSEQGRWYGNGAVFSPDGLMVAASATRLENGQAAEGLVRVWELSEGKLLLTSRTEDAGYRGVAFSPDGKLLAMGRNPRLDVNASIDLFQTDDWARREPLAFRPGFAISLVFAADSQAIIVAGGECENRNAAGCHPTGKIWFVPLDPAKPTKMVRPPDRQGYFRNVSLSADGQWFASGTSKVVRKRNSGFVQGQIQVRTAAEGDVVWTFDGEVGDAYGARFSPKGDLAAFCMDQSVWLLDAQTGKLKRRIEVRPQDPEE